MSDDRKEREEEINEADELRREDSRKRWDEKMEQMDREDRRRPSE